MSKNYLFHRSQPQPRALYLFAFGGNDLLEFEKYSVKICNWDANAGVLHRDHHKIFPDLRLKLDVAVFRSKLDGIANEVAKDLEDPLPVGLDIRQGDDGIFKGDGLGLGKRRQLVQGLLDQPGKRGRSKMIREHARLHFGEIEQ